MKRILIYSVILVCLGVIIITYKTYVIKNNSLHAPSNTTNTQIKRRTQPTPLTTPTIQASELKPGDYASSINEGNLVRNYILHVPSNYDGNKQSPLLIVLHGANDNATSLESVLGPNLFTQTDNLNTLVLFPNGTSINGTDNTRLGWNAGNCCGEPEINGINDLGFIKDLIKHLEEIANIDKNKIYIEGFSNGGIMAYYAACNTSNLLTGIIVISGTMNISECKTTNPLSVLIIHGDQDNLLPYQGGKIDISKIINAPNNPSTAEIPSIKDIDDFWAGEDKCTKNNSQTSGNSSIMTYSSCISKTKVISILIHGQGHIPNISPQNVGILAAIYQFFNGSI